MAASSDPAHRSVRTGARAPRSGVRVPPEVRPRRRGPPDASGLREVPADAAGKGPGGVRLPARSRPRDREACGPRRGVEAADDGPTSRRPTTVVGIEPTGPGRRGAGERGIGPAVGSGRRAKARPGASEDAIGRAKGRGPYGDTSRPPKASGGTSLAGPLNDERRRATLPAELPTNRGSAPRRRGVGKVRVTPRARCRPPHGDLFGPSRGFDRFYPPRPT